MNTMDVIMKYVLPVFLCTIAMSAHAETDKWVSVDRLERHTCPSKNCGIVGQLIFREKATILEEKDGWARISKYYDAACVNGVSEYVDSGNPLCKSSNGITDGKFAEWVDTRYLSATRPEDPSKDATGIHALVKGSDDYGIYKDTFADAAEKLIARGRCTAKDFKEMGGWWKSTNHKNKPIYFTYCGGMTRSNQLYLNAATGELL